MRERGGNWVEKAMLNNLFLFFLLTVTDVGQHVVAHFESLHAERRRKSVEEAVRDTERHEDEKRAQALADARKAADEEIAALRRKLDKDRRWAVEEEHQRTTVEMEKRADQMLRDERQAAARRLEQALAQAGDEASRRQEQAVKDGREEEYKLAVQRAERAAAEAQRCLEAAKARKDEQRRVALDDLTKAKDEERRKAVEDGKCEQADEDACVLAGVRADYEQQLQEVRDALDKEKRLRDDAEDLLFKTREERRKLGEEHEELRKEFAKFINTIPGLCSDFLMK